MSPRSPLPTLTPAAPVRSRHRRFDLVLGILLGIVLGVAVVFVFVFLGSEGSIDAPRIKGVDTGKPPAAKAATSRSGGERQPPP
jgi:hypothetical protein